METKEIILFAIVFAALGISIYRKYIRKNQPGQPGNKQKDSITSFSSEKDDDYEPYSK